MLEVRTNSYRNKAAILHIDRRSEFKRKLDEKNAPKKEASKNDDFRFQEKF